MQAIEPRFEPSRNLSLPQASFASMPFLSRDFDFGAQVYQARSFEQTEDFHAYAWDPLKCAGEYRAHNNFDRHFIEFCSASFNDLRQRFQQYMGPDVYLMDDERELAKRAYETTDQANIVLFGSALFRLLESGSWPFRSQKIFVLSRVLKDFLVDWFQFKPDEIGLISRADLYPLKSAKLKSSRGIQFVMAQRLSRSKRAELILAFVSYWQNNVDATASLLIAGSFDEHTNTFDDDDQKDYEQYFKQILNQLPWTIPPAYLGDRADWFEMPLSNPCYCNFSQYDLEDFSVALSEALTKGWPVFLSAFGGLLDVQGEGIYHWPQTLLATQEDLSTAGAKLSEYFQRAIQQPKDARSYSPSFMPQVVDQARLSELRHQALSQLGWSFHFLLKGMRAEFGLTPQGQTLIKKYRAYMRGEHLEST